MNTRSSSELTLNNTCFILNNKKNIENLLDCHQFP